MRLCAFAIDQSFSRLYEPTMNLESFRRAVDSCPDEITSRLGDLPALYAYVGLPVESNFARLDVSKELYKKIAGAFASGHQSVWRHCRSLRNELI